MMAKKDPRIAALASILDETAERAGRAMGLDVQQTADAIAAFVAAYAAGNASKGKEADAVKAIGEVVSSYAIVVERISALENAEIKPGVKPH